MPHSHGGHGACSPGSTDLPGTHAVTETDFIVSVGKAPLQRTVTVPRVMPQGESSPAARTEPGNRHKCSDCFLKHWKTPAPR